MGKINYIALDLEDNFIKNIYVFSLQLKNDLKNIGYELDIMEKHNLHMTLCFLGDCLKTNTKEKMCKVCENIRTFENNSSGNVLEYDSLDIFCSNLLVIKFKCVTSDFIDKTTAFKHKFEKIGAKHENYFTPHITIGKIKHVKHDTNLQQIVNKLDVHFDDKITVSKCHLV